MASSDVQLKVLLAADLHIGRGSSRVGTAEGEGGGGGEGAGVRAAGAWGRLVDLALARRVDAVLLAGDVADQDAAFFEAFGHLNRGVIRLADAGIRTLAVAGNHDHAVLPRLARQLGPERFTLLGEGGVWQRVTLEDREGRPALGVIGWSFPRGRVTRSPVEDPLPAADEEACVPTLGMVHGDLDVPSSVYAPLDSARLEAAGVDGWLLGHIHKPMLRTGLGRAWVLYPGSVQALDPGEQGAHGAWLMEVQRGVVTRPEMVGVSNVRYEPCEVVLDESVRSVDAVEARLVASAREAARRCVEDEGEGGGVLEHVVLRLRVTGRCGVSTRVRGVVERFVADPDPGVRGVRVSVESATLSVLPAIDLAEHAGDRFGPGVLARLLLELREAKEGDEEMESSVEVRELLAEVRREMEEAGRHRDYAALGEEQRSVTQMEVREVLQRQASALLGELLAQHAAAAG